MIPALTRWLRSRAGAPVMTQAAAPVPAADPVVSFACNVCGGSNHGVPLGQVADREGHSCRCCGSSLRMRSLMYLLSLELFGEPVPLPEFPLRRDIRGLGMSDWDGYALALARKVDYTNTFYHQEPRLDISAIDASQVGRYRFLISSDVFEHIPPASLDAAFANSRRLLADGGSFILTVPYLRQAATREHFPRLHDWRIVEAEGHRRLVNRTVEGDEETFDDLVFHGGEGMTLEMRLFAESDLLQRLAAAGFSSVRIRGEHYAPYGVLWPVDFSLPIVARA